MANSRSLAEIDQRMAIVRENIRQLIEQAAAQSGAADESLASDRIAQQTEELERLTKERDALVKKGADKLLDVLQDMPAAGHFGAPGQLSWDLRFAWKTRLPEGGERVVLVTDRRIGVWEATRQPRSFDYPFTVIELRLNAEGEGEGKMSLATKVIHDKDNNTITLENYQLQPVMLTHVTRERVKPLD